MLYKHLVAASGITCFFSTVVEYEVFDGYAELCSARFVETPVITLIAVLQPSKKRCFLDMFTERGSATV